MLGLTSISGLPAHPLFAHIPVVLIPLAALGAVAMLWPRLRDQIGWFVVGAVFVAGVCAQLTISSGQGLKNYVRETHLLRVHTQMGENIRPWVLLMFLALLGVMVVAHVARLSPPEDGNDTSARLRSRRLAYVGLALATLSIVFSAMATYWIYKIGHSGSKAVWAPTQLKIDRNQPNREGREHNG